MNGLSTSRDAGRVVVIGGGVAGIAAAVRLAEQGVAVTLIETRKRLGGRATSFVDPTTGEMLDNCQHVLMRCCTNLIDLYERLGVSDCIEWHRKLYFADRHGTIDELEADDVAAPMHMARPLLKFTTLSAGEKFAIVRGMLAVMQVSRRGRSWLAGESFAHWLKRHHQSAGVIGKFWGPVIVSACNEELSRVPASYAIQVFQEGFLYDKDGYTMGIAAVPLVQLYDAAEHRLSEAGGSLRLSTSADSFVFADGQVRAVRLADGEEVAGDVFISSVPFDRLAKLATPAMAEVDERLRRLDELDVSPIIGVHLFFRRADGQPVMTLPHLALMDSPVHWLFNKTQDAGLGTQDAQGGQHLHAVISAAHDLVSQPAEQIISLAVAETRRVLPPARDAELVHARVVKEKRATFSLQPGVDQLRPGTTGAIDNLFLAGDWVDTGWPATMEGAARSGYRAAAATLARLGVAGDMALAADLRPSLLYRLLSG